MLPLEGDKEVKEGKGLKILTPNKVSTRLPVLLAQIKAGNNSNNLKMKSDKYFFIRNQTNTFYQHNKITKKLYNTLIKSLQ